MATLIWANNKMIFKVGSVSINQVVAGEPAPKTAATATRKLSLIILKAPASFRRTGAFVSQLTRGN